MKTAKTITLLLICVLAISFAHNTYAQTNTIPQVSVNGFSGAATASIPIVVPPGRAGMQPNLKLTYNSYKRNGWIGMGWDLSLGSIQRSNRHGLDYDAYDFVANGQELLPVGHTGGEGQYRARIEGGFAIYEFTHAGGWVVTAKDGKKLYYGQETGSRQDDPQDPTNRVFKWCLDKVVDTNGNYMVATYDKDQGQIYLKQIDYAGNAGGSSTLPPSNSVIFHYDYGRLDLPEMFNTNFEVVTANLLKTIEVRASGQLAGAYSINYEPLENLSSPLIESVHQYGSDATIVDGSIGSGTTLNNFVLAWSKNNSKKIVHAGANETQEETYWSWVVDSDTKHGKVFSMDINGDGRGDLVLAYQDPNNRITTMQHWISDGAKLVYSELSLTTSETYWCNVVDSDNYDGKVFSMDINGDGKGDLVMAYQEPSNNKTIMHYWMSDGSKLVYAGADQTHVNTYWNAVLNSGPQHGKVFSMDITGDGRSDLVLAYQDPNNRITIMQHWISDGSKLVYSESSLTASETYWCNVVDSDTYDGKVFSMDINGDGKGDLVMAYQEPSNNKTIMHYWISDGGKLVYAGADRTHVNTYWNSVLDSGPYHGKAIPMDINGDGRRDLVLAYQDPDSRTTIMRHWISDGNKLVYTDQALTTSETYWCNVVDSDTQHGQVFAMDINGDGRGDMVLAYQDPGSRISVMHNWISDGNQLVYTDEVHTTTETYWSSVLGSSPYRGKVFPMDINGDGRRDLVMAYQDVDSRITIMHNWISDGPTPNLLESVSNGVGATISFEYANSSEYINTLLPFILHTVSKRITEIKTGGSMISSEVGYTYEGGLFDYVTREFRGFREAIQTNPNSTTKKTNYYQGDPNAGYPENVYALKGKINYIEERETTEQTSETNLIGRSDFTWGIDDLTQGCEFVYLDHKVTYSYENGQQFSELHEDNDFDAVGNLTKTRTWDMLASAEAVTKTFTYNNFADPVTAPDIPQMWRTTMEKIEGDTSELVRRVDYRYTSDGRANIEEKEHWNNDGDNPVLKFVYFEDSINYGNVWQELDAKGDLIAEYTYDPATETFPETVTNALDHALTKTYDYRFGTVLTEIDANENTTTNHYDEFGRIERVEMPNGGESLIHYQDDAFLRWVRTSVKESANPDVYTRSWEFFDGLGRTIQTVAVGEDDKRIVTRMEYDDMGREKAVYGPFFVADTTEGVLHPIPIDAPKAWTDYDLRSRPVGTNMLDEQNVDMPSTISYDGLSSTVTGPDGSQKKTTKDYLGRIREVVEYTDTGSITTTYTYNAAGDLATVEDTAGNNTAMTYDTLGRKLTMSDPDMGFWEYRYDKNGNLVWQKDANLKEIEFDYDVLDRVLAKRYLNPIAGQDHDVTYNYDGETITTDPVQLSALNLRGSLSRVTNGQVTETYDAYDELGQALSVTKAISGDASRATAFTFDLAGKPVDTVYPGGYTVRNAYFPGTGLLQSVYSTTDFVTYAEYSNYPATGKVGEVIYGKRDANDYVSKTTYTYDPLSARLTHLRADNDAGTAMMNKTYGYSKAGDIEDINDDVRGISYFYQYDKLHRLREETNSGTEDTLTYTYDDLGRFVTKSKGAVVMNYDAFDPAHVHAVKSLTVSGFNYQFAYDANGNMTAGHDLTDLSNPATRNIKYNSDNMPYEIDHSANGITTFIYDGSSSRAKKVGAVTTTYYYGAHFEKQGATEVKYIFAAGQRVAMIKNGQVRYFHKDHLGSSTLLTDDQGVEIESAEYLPFGGDRFGGTGITESNYGFTDQEKDPETGLYNYNARLYDPVLGVFISADTVVPDPGGSQAFNRYAYCINNPLIYTDPSGHFIDRVISAVVGAVVGGIKAALTGEDIGEAMLQGAVSGLLFSFAGDLINSYNTFAGDVVLGLGPAEPIGALGQAGIHAVAGGLAGGINAAIAGNDIGQGMIFGAATSAFGKYVGVGHLKYQNAAVQGAGYMLSGAVMGGGIAQLTGGDFNEGLMNGLKNAAYGFAFNQMGVGKRIGNFFSRAYNEITGAFAYAGKEMWDNRGTTWKGFKWAGQTCLLSKTWVFSKAGVIAGSAYGGAYAAPTLIKVSNSLYIKGMVFAGTTYKYTGTYVANGAGSFLNSALPGVPDANLYGAAGWVSGKIYNYITSR